VAGQQRDDWSPTAGDWWRTASTTGQLIDEATGRLVADLGGGAPVPDLDGRVAYPGSADHVAARAGPR
jgi:hypothetical protein